MPLLLVPKAPDKTDWKQAVAPNEKSTNPKWIDAFNILE